jgi:hypothetical protein
LDKILNNLDVFKIPGWKHLKEKIITVVHWINTVILNCKYYFNTHPCLIQCVKSMSLQIIILFHPLQLIRYIFQTILITKYLHIPINKVNWNVYFIYFQIHSLKNSTSSTKYQSFKITFWQLFCEQSHQDHFLSLFWQCQTIIQNIFNEIESINVVSMFYL